MQKKLRLLLLVPYLATFLNIGVAPTPVFAQTTLVPIRLIAQTDACPKAHSHQEGDLCICDTYYKGVGGECVPLTEAEMCPIANSHRVGDQCLCNSFFKAENGECVAMSQSEICPTAHTHQDGENCVCDDGYGAVKGVCYLKTALCEAHHAKYDASIDDCKCNDGYKENDAQSDCTPVAGSETPSSDDSGSTTTSTTVTPPQPSTTTTPPASEPIANPPTSTSEGNIQDAAASGNTDPANLILLLKDDASNPSTNSKALDASLKGLDPSQLQSIDDQKTTLTNYVNSDDSSVEFSTTDNQKKSIAEGAVIKIFSDKEQKWNEQLQQAEQAGNVKNPEDKQKFEDLKLQENSLATQLKNNQDAMNVLYKQALQIMNTEQSWSGSMYYGDKKFQDAPKRDFMKESQGDPNMALVYNTQAISGQYKLLAQIKDEMRQVKEQKQSLLNVPPKPNLEDSLKNDPILKQIQDNTAQVNFYKNK